MLSGFSPFLLLIGICFFSSSWKIVQFQIYEYINMMAIENDFQEKEREREKHTQNFSIQHH